MVERSIGRYGRKKIERQKVLGGEAVISLYSGKTFNHGEHGEKARTSFFYITRGVTAKKRKKLRFFAVRVVFAVVELPF